MSVSDNGSDAPVAGTKSQATFWAGLISETTKTIRLARELRNFRKEGSTQDLTQFYTLQDNLAQQCDLLNQMSPPEARRNHLKRIDERRQSISVHADTVAKWVKDIEPLMPQYMLRDPVADLSARVQRLCKQRKEWEKRRLSMQKEIADTEELEEGEIRESPPAEANPSEVGVSNFLTHPVTSNRRFLKLLELVKQLHASRKVVPRDPEDIPASVDSVLASEAVKRIIRDETTYALNAGISPLLVTIGNLEDTRIVKAWDMLEDIFKILETINDHSEQAGVHTHAGRQVDQASRHISHVNHESLS